MLQLLLLEDIIFRNSAIELESSEHQHVTTINFLIEYWQLMTKLMILLPEICVHSSIR